MIFFFFFFKELQISAGFQELSLAERGGRRRDFHDLGVNTRQNLDHVKESKTGVLIIKNNKNTVAQNYFSIFLSSVLVLK